MTDSIPTWPDSTRAAARRARSRRPRRAYLGKRLKEGFERRSVELSHDQWLALEDLAVQLQVRSEGGAAMGSPSWRTCIRLIAKGALVVKWKGKRERAATAA